MVQGVVRRVRWYRYSAVQPPRAAGTDGEDPELVVCLIRNEC